MERPVAEKRGPGVTIGGHLRVRSRRRLIPNGSRKGSRAVRARLRVFAPVAATVTKSREAGGAAATPPPPCHTTVRTGPYPAVRDGYASIPRIRTECGLGFRFQSSPRTAQPLPFPPLGLHPSAQKRSPVRSGYSAVCRP